MKQEANAAEFSDGNVMNPSKGFVGHPAPVAMSAIQLLYNIGLTRYVTKARVPAGTDVFKTLINLFWFHSFLSWAITKTKICCMPYSHWTCVMCMW